MSGVTLSQMDMAEYLEDPNRKQRYVTTVFEIVAPSYDRFTRYCSMGLDMAWKRELLALVKTRLGGENRVVDLACGTGDLTFALARMIPGGKVLGLDVADGMLRLAEQRRRRLQVQNAEFGVGDMMDLPLPPASVDGVTVSYGLRNAPDPGRVLAEVQRVLKPGGFLASLDFTRPGNPLWRRLFLFYLLLAGNFYGWLWHRQPAAYAYLTHSIARFHSAAELSRAMAGAGLEVMAEHPRLLGAICIHLARKKP